MACEHSVSRRQVLGGTGALFAWSFMPRLARAAGGARDPRFVCIVLRGGMDGLSVAVPVGDPDYLAVRESIALTLDGPNPAISLDGFFALHPSMPRFAALYKAKQAAVVHAVATGYRERSHFDAQDVLESGQPRPGRTESGWLNRFMLALPKGDRIEAPRRLAGIGQAVPLIARGRAPVMGWSPPVLQGADDDVTQRLLDLYRETDTKLAGALAAAIEAERLASGGGPGSIAGKVVANPARPEGMKLIAEGAARLMAADGGPRIAALAFDGWDTHADEGGATGRLATLLAGLDGALGVFADILKPVWNDTAILVVTEFGRTVRVNGTTGTDHGTATVAMLAGGAVRGGRVLADWPGLAPANLYEQRDLKPTADVRAVAKGVLAEMFGVSADVLARDVFPDTAAIKPVRGLVA